jgi:predicted nucleotidyltransferase
MSFGLNDRDIKTIYNIFGKYPEVKTVWLFGSRAKGTFHTGSDIDMAVMDSDVSNETVRNILSDFEDSTLPYFTDVVNYHKTEHEELKEHIQRVGVLLYDKSQAGIIHEPPADYKKGRENT